MVPRALQQRHRAPGRQQLAAHVEPLRREVEAHGRRLARLHPAGHVAIGFRLTIWNIEHRGPDGAPEFRAGGIAIKKCGAPPLRRSNR